MLSYAQQCAYIFYQAKPELFLGNDSSNQAILNHYASPIARQHLYQQIADHIPELQLQGSIDAKLVHIVKVLLIASDSQQFLEVDDQLAEMIHKTNQIALHYAKQSGHPIQFRPFFYLLCVDFEIGESVNVLLGFLRDQSCAGASGQGFHQVRRQINVFRNIVAQVPFLNWVCQQTGVKSLSTFIPRKLLRIAVNMTDFILAPYNIIQPGGLLTGPKLKNEARNILYENAYAAATHV